jgi:hypothetical protein
LVDIRDIFYFNFDCGSRLKSKFREYSAIPTANGMSVAKVARKMLYDPGCYDVNITSVQGTLTDQYNPQTKTVNLSQDVYYGTNVAAAAVATKQAMLCNMLMRMLGQPAFSACAFTKYQRNYFKYDFYWNVFRLVFTRKFILHANGTFNNCCMLWSFYTFCIYYTTS